MDLSHSAQPMLIAGRIFGFFPFKIISGRFLIPTSSKIYFLVRLVLSVLVVTHRNLYADNYLQKGSFLSQITFILGSIILFTFIFSVTILNICNRKNYEIWFRNIEEFDQQVKSSLSLIKIS
jgi:ABC-type multidrug transport system permease subunit